MPPLPPLRFAPEPERKYFGKVADATPEDTMLLTLGCGKFRFFDHQYGDIPNTSLPRLVSRQERARCCSSDLLSVLFLFPIAFWSLSPPPPPTPPTPPHVPAHVPS